MPRGRGSSRRGSGGRGRSGSRGRARRGPELAPDLDRLAAELCTEMADEARSKFSEVTDGLDAELWASSLVEIWSFGPAAPPGLDTDQVFGVGVVRALERAGDAGALAALRALAAVAPQPVAVASATAAEGFARNGVEEPIWKEEIAAVRPLRAMLMRDRVFDDGVTVFAELERPGHQPFTVGVLVDHNLGGIAKDVLVCGPLSEVEQMISAVPPEVSDGGEIEFTAIDPGEAGVRMRDALWRTEVTLAPPVGEDFGSMRAIAVAHARALAADEEPPEEVEVSESVRDAAFDGFFASSEGKRFDDDEDALDLAIIAIDFGSHCVGGIDRPLRWSPTVVELFLTWFLPAKIAREPSFFERVPELLEAWVRYAGRNRGLEPDAIEIAAGAVGEFSGEMLEAIGDESAWGPAKAVGMAALSAGVDLGDEDAIEEFVERWNEQRAA